MRGAAWLGFVVACAPAQSTTLSNPAGRDVPVQTEPAAKTRRLLPRPHVDIAQYMPDFHEELRWPLSMMQHPTLEPSYAIAEQFAEPGVRWTDLCAAGAQNRSGSQKELTAYLRGWCKALTGDVDAALTNLVPLLGAPVSGLDESVRVDVANILANDGHSDKAQHWLNKLHIQDAALLDTLAATYVEVGTRADALTINQLAIDSDDHAAPGTKCMRWTRAIVLRNDKQSPLLFDIQQAVGAKSGDDATCRHLWNALQCWTGQTSCHEFLDDNHASPELESLLDAYLMWPYRSRQIDDWENTALIAAGAITLPGGADLAMTATENILIVSQAGCTLGIQAVVDNLDRHIRPLLHDRRDLDARFQDVRAACQPKERL